MPILLLITSVAASQPGGDQNGYAEIDTLLFICYIGWQN